MNAASPKPASNTSSKEQEARALMQKSRSFQMFGGMFALVGFGVFMVLFVRNVEGRFFEALANPATVLILLIPFLPAAFLTHKSKALEKKALQLLNKKP